jgi:hypothetical protein
MALCSVVLGVLEIAKARIDSPLAGGHFSRAERRENPSLNTGKGISAWSEIPAKKPRPLRLRRNRAFQ